MQDEAEKIEDCIKENLNGEIRTVYGCSLGGTLAAMLAERGNVRIRHAVIGSSDFDICGEILARLETKLMVKMIYPLLTTGRMLPRKALPTSFTVILSRVFLTKWIRMARRYILSMQ